MSDTKEQTELEKILLQFIAEYHQGLNELAGRGTSTEQATAAIQSAIAEAIPEKYPDPDKAFTDDKIDWDALQAQRAYNFAIDQFTANLRTKGLLR